MDNIEDFIGLVRDLRNAQKKYFASRSYEDLMAAKRLENEVDRRLKEPMGKKLFRNAVFFKEACHDG